MMMKDVHQRYNSKCDFFCGGGTYQARTEPASKKTFINDTIRNDFHKKFISKYVK